jgi:photosystem II stability/assembly factor-like uncharacterized protein
LDFDPAQPQTLYAGTSGGVYKSVDGAKTWIQVNAGLVPPDLLKSSRALGVTRIKVDPHHPDTVYTASLDGLYKTVNGGLFWKRIGTTLSDQMLSDLILDPRQADILYVTNRKGVARSQDGGETWEYRNEGLTNLNIRAIAISPLDADLLFVGTNGKGLFRSRNSGLSWESVPLHVAEAAAMPS